MDEIREAMSKKQRQIDDLENVEGSKEEIDKLKRELRSLETEHEKARSKYEGSVQAGKDRSTLEEEVQVLEDSQAAGVAKSENENASKLSNQ